MVRRLSMGVAAALLVLLTACSGGEEKEKTRIYDTERAALEKAKEVESVLQKADEKRKKEIEEGEKK